MSMVTIIYTLKYALETLDLMMLSLGICILIAVPIVIAGALAYLVYKCLKSN